MAMSSCCMTMTVKRSLRLDNCWLYGAVMDTGSLP